MRQGARFEFGKNWWHFLSTLNDRRIAIAEQSLAASLELPRLDGMSFLDAGSGSGLFSLAARRLGARVTSFDYDPQSVACTTELRRRYFPDDADWRVMRGSVLDTEFLGRLGQFDIVYSWGVLHHTGAMYTALANVKPLVPIGGRLFIAIYNDLGAKTDWWWRVKRIYNALPSPLKLLYALAIIGAIESRSVLASTRQGKLKDYLRIWTDYQTISARGMSRWHDWIDWIGGFPYERADIDTIVDFYARDGFRLSKLISRSSGTGCNEFVFFREAPEGRFISQKVSGSPLFARRCGYPLVRAEPGSEGDLRTWLADRSVIGANPPNPGIPWLLLQQDRLLGEIAPPDASGMLLIPAAIAATKGFAADRLTAAPARREPFAQAPVHQRASMWAVSVPHLAEFADNLENPTRSAVFIFEDDRQLPTPHSEHAQIAHLGDGRFSHWGETLYFSTTDRSDPISNGRHYSIVYPIDPATGTASA